MEISQISQLAKKMVNRFRGLSLTFGSRQTPKEFDEIFLHESSSKPSSQPNPKPRKLSTGKPTTPLQTPSEIQPELKICLIGCGGAGKSTIFRQCETLFGDGYSEKVLSNYTPFVQQSLVEKLKALFEFVLNECSMDRKIVDKNTELKMKLFLEKHKSEQFIGDKILDPQAWVDILNNDEVKGILANLHQHPAINSSIGNCIEFYIEDYSRLTTINYTALETDYIKFQQKTTGIVQHKFTYKNTPFLLMDVGGQRNERKKWINALSVCNALVYVVSLSEFDEICMEDEKTNRLVEDFATFQEWSKNDLVKEKMVYLLFTNTDRFQKKIRDSKRLEVIRNIFPEHDISDDVRDLDAVIFSRIVEEFSERDYNNRIAGMFKTNVLDCNELRSAMSSMLDMMINK